MLICLLNICNTIQLCKISNLLFLYTYTLNYNKIQIYVSARY